MNAVYNLAYAKLAADPQFGALATALAPHQRIDSPTVFNDFCREAIRLWQRNFPTGRGQTSPLFGNLSARISRGDEGVIPTAWGGVVVTVHQPPRVEKFLVIRSGGYLALETHAEKDERLEVKEGAGLLLWRREQGEPLTVQSLAPGEQFHFLPGMEHCLIGTENLLVFEQSIDPKGMDQDLIFIYEPDNVAADFIAQ